MATWGRRAVKRPAPTRHAAQNKLDLRNGGPRPESARGPLHQSRFGAYVAAHRWALIATLAQFRRAPISTLLTCAVLGIALALPAGLFVLLDNVQGVAQRWDGGAQISLFLKAGATEAQALKLAEQLRARGDIARVDYISKVRALEEFQRNSGMADALALLGENPLPPVLVVFPKERQAKPDVIQKLAEGFKALPSVEIAQWDMQWLQRLHAFITMAQRAVAVVSVLVLVAILVVIGNTIRLAVQNRAPEIKVTKLIGASDAFVRRPFLYSGVCYGMFGSVLAWLLVAGFLTTLADPVHAVAASYGSAFELQGIGWELSLGLIATGIFLGTLGSWLAVGRHLRAIEPGSPNGV